MKINQISESYDGVIALILITVKLFKEQNLDQELRMTEINFVEIPGPYSC